MKLIDDAAWLAKRLWSVRLAAIGVIWASAGAYWIATPADWKPDLSEGVRWTLAAIGVALAAAPGLGALIDQPKLAQAKAARQLADKAGVMTQPETVERDDDLGAARGIITACVVSIVFWALVLLACWLKSRG